MCTIYYIYILYYIYCTTKLNLEFMAGIICLLPPLFKGWVCRGREEGRAGELGGRQEWRRGAVWIGGIGISYVALTLSL